MTLNLEQGFADFLLQVEAVSFDSSGKCLITAGGREEGLDVGLQVLLPAGMKCGLVERGDDLVLEEDRVYYNGVEFRSLGTRSENFLAVLAKAYEVPLQSPKMAGATAFTCIVLEGDMESFAERPVKCKLFFDEKMLREDNDEDYCELYLNIDLKLRILEIAEKDQEYRANIMRALNEVAPEP